MHKASGGGRELFGHSIVNDAHTMGLSLFVVSGGLTLAGKFSGKLLRELRGQARVLAGNDFLSSPAR